MSGQSYVLWEVGGVMYLVWAETVGIAKLCTFTAMSRLVPCMTSVINDIINNYLLLANESTMKREREREREKSTLTVGSGCQIVEKDIKISHHVKRKVVPVQQVREREKERSKTTASGINS